MKLTIEVTTTTNAKFDALLNACKQAQETANAIKAEVNPVIEAVGAAKWDVILEEIDKFTFRYNRFMKLCKGNKWFRIPDHIIGGFAGIRFINYESVWENYCAAKFTYNGKDIHEIADPASIEAFVLSWNESNVIEDLDKRLENKMNDFIRIQAEEAKNRIEVMNNLIG